MSTAIAGFWLTTRRGTHEMAGDYHTPRLIPMGMTALKVTTMIRVLLVDDQPAVLDGLRMRFMLETDLEVVGAASDGASALRLVEEVHPDVIVMDAFMPEMDGIAATIEHRRDPAACPVIVLSLYDDP